MALSERERDQLLTQLARDVRAIRKVLAPEDERPAATRKRDARALYGDGRN
jgi:hypothetical protein